VDGDDGGDQNDLMSESLSAHRVSLASAGVPLAQVIATEELLHRSARTPDLAAENRVLLALAETMARAPHEVLKRLVDEACALCHADSAGISLLDNDVPPGEAPRFVWKATSGGLGPFEGNAMPRNFSPCGTVLDCNETLLMSHPVRHFRYIEELPMPVCEVLLVPFFRNGVSIGTVWVAAHSDDRKFDAEDARLIRSLSQFAAAAIQVLDAAEAEARRHRLAHELAQDELASMTLTKIQLENADRERTQFLATLAHEMRNGLCPMANAVRILARSKEPQAQMSAREILQRQLAQLNRLVEDLLDTSRISSGKLHLKLTELDLTSLVRNVAEANRIRIEQSGQHLSLEMPAGPLRVRGDEVRLSQVLTNLVTNAAKYGAAGGTVTVSLRAEGTNAVIRVRDTGVGIEAAMLSKVFDLFVQLDHTLGKSQGGLGIGLALVKRLVSMHGGSVAAHSEGLGKGSEFCVSLPLL
jgi:signal transduction histidine kinase